LWFGIRLLSSGKANRVTHHEAQGGGASERAVPMRIPRVLEAVRLDGRRA
jgi:hypothetical protein